MVMSKTCTETLSFQFHDLICIRQYLLVDSTILVAKVLFSSRLDFCNSLFRSLSCIILSGCQCVQNTLALIVTNQHHFTRATLIFKKLHWLPVKYPGIFKVTTFVHKFLNSQLWHPAILSFPTTAIIITRCGRTDRRILSVPKVTSGLMVSKLGI